MRRQASIQIGLSAVAVACLLSAGLLDGLGMAGRAWLLFGGFLLLAAAMALFGRDCLMPMAIAAIFVLYGGVSALVAIPDPPSLVAKHAKALTDAQLEASKKAPRYERGAKSDQEAFKDAALITALAGIAAVAGAAFASRRRRDLVRRAVSPTSVENAGRGLVFVAFLGVAAALARFALTQLPTDDLQDAIKSFWVGGSYFLLVATFAIPGFALWLQGALMRRASRRDYVWLAGTVGAYLVLLVPTGQRGFAIALAAIALVILLFDGRISVRVSVAAVVALIVLLGLSQAARNQIRETNGLAPSGFVERIAPREWKNLYGSQLASFNWTVEIERLGNKLEIPNSFPRALLKPIPRQIYPEKSQGFGSEFTERVYPEAARQKVSFAVPLTSEADYSFGLAGTVVIFLALGLIAGFAESRIVARAPRMVAPVVLATIVWCCFVLLRGDLANALVFGGGWVIPLLLVSRSIGLRRERAPERVVIDALQVAPQFSGVGRQVEDIGRSLTTSDSMPLPLRIRCARDVRDGLAEVFPPATRFHTPLRSSRPRLLRIAYQQLWAPIWDRRSTVLVALGDQAPVWGRAKLVFAINDVRRITRPDTVGGRVESLFYTAVLKRGAHRARRILTISRFSRDEIVRLLDPYCPITVVASHSSNRDTVDIEQRNNGDGTRFVTVGALRSYKGHDTLLLALADFNKHRQSQAEVLCIGGDETQNGRERELADRAKELGVGEEFQLRGWVSDEELNSLVCSCTATINPSRYEGYGLPVAESIALGLPTIASDIPPHREIAQDAALYFEPGDAEALATIMERIANDPGLREELARKARERWRELSQDQPSLGEAIREAVEAEMKTELLTEDAEPEPAAAY